MKKFLLVFLCLPVLAIAYTPQGRQPNIILVIADDLGWQDTGFMGNQYIETPNLDRLANEGLVFSDAYSASPNCAPSRAAIMSGQHATRTGIFTMMSGAAGQDNLRKVIPPDNKMVLDGKIITLAERLKSAGYTTGHFGKWNLGSGLGTGPQAQGFDINVGGSRAGHPTQGYLAPFGLPGLEHVPEGTYLTEYLVDETIGFMLDNKEKPFFIQLSFYAPHFPFESSQQLVKKYKSKSVKGLPEDHPAEPVYAAMVEGIDQGIGRIKTALENLGIQKDTLLVFTSDNGGLRGLYSLFNFHRISNLGPLRGEKSEVYEGGIRVPLMMWWPGGITDSGVVDQAVSGLDLYPTLTRLAGLELQNDHQKLDGISLTALFRQNERALGRRDPLYWYFPAYVAWQPFDDIRKGENFRQRPVAVMREGDWKLISYLDDNTSELYNLKQDVAEKNDLSGVKGSRRAEMQIKLDTWLLKQGRGEPLKENPAYDASAVNPMKSTFWNRLKAFFL